MQRVQTAELQIQRQRGAPLDQILVDLDDGERRPLPIERFRRGAPRRQSNSPHRLDVTDATREPTVSASHRVAYECAAGLGDIALDERARVEVQVQRSASRSERTSSEALR